MHKNRINLTRAATKAESWWGCSAQVKSQVALKSAAANWQMTLHAVGFCFYRKCLSNERISKVPHFRTWQYTYIRKHKGHKRSEKLKTQKNARSISMEGSKAKGTKFLFRWPPSWSTLIPKMSTWKIQQTVTADILESFRLIGLTTNFYYDRVAFAKIGLG